MKSSTAWKNLVLIATLMLTGNVLAVTPDEEDEKVCKKPKFRDANPAHLAEVKPESVISFHISRGADPHSVTAEARGEKMSVEVQNKMTFLLATAKLPATVNEGFARIHVTAKAQDGGCLGQDGWLLKIQSAEAGAAKPENK